MMMKSCLKTTNKEKWLDSHYEVSHHRLAQPTVVGKMPVYRAGGTGLIPGWTNTQGLKRIEEKVLPLL